MQVRHFFTALLFAFGIGQFALAEEPAQADAQQPVQQAPAVQEQAATGEKPVAKAEAAPVQATAPAKAEATPVTAPSPVPSFIHDIKLTDVLLAIFAGMLVLLGRDLARRTRDAATVARDSAAVAEKSARVAEDALIAGQRAFMFIREIKTYLHQDPDTGGFHWTIHPIWANSGNTPTRGLAINTTYRLLDAPLPKDFEFPASQDAPVPTIAGPRSMVEAVSGSISADDLAAVKEGRKFFYIWGWAEYHDIFEGTKKRVTRFCNQLIEIDGNPASPVDAHAPLQMMFGFHAENNYAD
ncbi:hypothetical protein [Noviherbaspirillum denitrificans]|uniref:Uncharacterized protein n=1 Tax=Noviherbaspirillum denitrificans TaxID=1968433 RepID=A0A254T954_9BURK|nr:hypothetical protein [Noviherbaspirillum denitrificans]OWW19176.1 hypothetical protein AYR66_06355 [Noviherbaspirillum denitrificans]